MARKLHTSAPALVTKRSYRIQNRDFVVNSIWEGAGDELHSNDFYAAKTEYGARIISGIALVSLCVAEHMGEQDWQAPRRAAMSFDSAVKSGDCIDIELARRGANADLQVSVEGQRALRIAFDQDGELAPDRSDDCLRTKGRTITSGDREAFDWWISRSLPDVDLAPPDLVPWPLLASTVSGFMGRKNIVRQPHSSLVNRYNEWSFFRPVQIGETVHAEIYDPGERDSRSRPGWGVWSGRVVVVSRNKGDVVGCSNWVCMYMFDRPETDEGGAG